MSDSTSNEIRWRRRTRPEAFRLIPVSFTVAAIVGVVWDALFKDTVDCEDAFFRAVWFAVAFPLASLAFKTKGEFE